MIRHVKTTSAAAVSIPTFLRSASSRCGLLVVAGLFAAVAGAQRRVEPPDYEQPTHSDIVLGGNEQHQTVSCRGGNAVYIQGQSNQIDVQGACRFVRLQGNRNHVFVEGKSPVYVEGNENWIEVADPNVPFSERGERNRIERRAR